VRFGILANLAVILIVSGALLFVVFTASLQHALVDDAAERAGRVADAVEARLRQSASIAEVWRWARDECAGGSEARVRLYDASGREMGGGDATQELPVPPDKPLVKTGAGRRLEVTEPSPYGSVARGAIVILNVWGDFPYGVRSFRIVIKAPPALFSRAWTFFGAYLVLTQAVLFLLGYVLFQRTVLRPLRSLAELAGKASSLAEPEPLSEPRALKEDTRVIAAGLRRMITGMIEAARANEILIRDLREANKELAAAQAGLIRSEKMAVTGRLAAGLAHEIGNPLQILMGYAELLRSSDDEGLRRDIVPRMQAELTRINDIIRRLLEFARPAPEAAGPCDLNRLAHDCVRLLEGRPGFGRLRVVEAYAPDLPEIVTEAEKVRQILVNLLFNAADAAPSGGGEITIRTRSGPRHVEIEVADSGCGIPAEHLEKVFDPFFTTKDPGKGTGLGLTVSLALAESIGGTIKLASPPGGGCSASLILPTGRRS
jgi:signal transduction histidine kinase